MPNIVNSEPLSKAEQLYQQAEDLIAQGKYQQANQLLKQAESLLENSAQMEKEKKVIIASPKSEKKRSIENIISQIDKAAKEKNISKLLAYYEQYVQLRKDDPDGYYNLGVIYVKIGRIKQAEEQFLKVIELNPYDAEAYYNLGIIYELYNADKKNALLAYNRYLKLAKNPRDKKIVEQWIKLLESEDK